MTFTAQWNEGSTPFRWVKTADQILAKRSASRQLQVNRDTSRREARGAPRPEEREGSEGDRERIRCERAAHDFAHRLDRRTLWITASQEGAGPPGSERREHEDEDDEHLAGHVGDHGGTSEARA